MTIWSFTSPLPYTAMVGSTDAVLIDPFLDDLPSLTNGEFQEALCGPRPASKAETPRSLDPLTVQLNVFPSNSSLAVLGPGEQ